MMNVVAVQMQSHPWIVGMCMISVMKERYGREGLDDVIKMATRMRRSLLDDEKLHKKGRGKPFGG
ncbi:hypothetical protein [Sphingomonas abietis]|uniref:Uncharacterized protein n=1 Tax=Sphingomonas abietis TaxID=3012344 RepID=A0ABY7NLW0_9SPHN|nr:hypothetical protein [Sphingomonas abietis]WBO22509.1 hypothetical protein PBT88_20640 [Sphingomonas abietis]